MPDDPSLPVPPPPPPRRALDRAALDRVLARATELQGSDTDAREELTEEQLLELGREVGISADALRRALAEERTRVVLEEEPGMVARIAGPAMVGAARVVPGRPEELLARIDAWMRREECLQVKRRHADRLTWEPRRDMVAQIKAGLNIGGKGYALARAGEVAATVAAVDAVRTHVQLTADVGPARRARVAGGATAATAGALSGGGLLLIPLVAAHAMLLPFVAGAAVLAGAGAGVGWAVARTHRRVAIRTQTALEQLLDRLEHDEMRPSPSAQLLETLQSALKKRP